MQVKSGGAKLPPKDYERAGQRVFLFAESGEYPGPRPSNIECIDREILARFAEERPTALPNRLRSMLEFAQVGRPR